MSERCEPPPEDWQPIETAPTDGTAVLCWPFNYSSLFEGKAEPEIVIGFFSEDDWWCESTVAKTFDPTHWRPLPAPPEGQPGARASFAVDIPLSATAIVLAGVFVYRIVEKCF